MEKKRILIVDDESTYTRMMKLVLEKTGLYEVCQENKGKQAAAVARAFNPDLVLLDVVMPDMDGGDVAISIREDPRLKNVPIVFLTALVGETEMRKGPVKRAGFRFLGKLASDAELFKCIEENLRRSPGPIPAPPGW